MATQASIEIKRLHTCSLADALQAWNEGFLGYFIDMTLTLNGYLARLTSEELSPDYSLIAYRDGRPAGFLLNGLRTIAGEKVAWNGGTGVSPEFRGQGVAKALMRATLDLYREQQVEVAMLEAISDNESAIALYRQFGYDISDRLSVLQRAGELESASAALPDHGSFLVDVVAPQVVAGLGFYPRLAPWQTHWQSVSRKGGEALVVADADGVPVGFALYQRKFDEQGQLSGIVLYQCVADPDRADVEAIVRLALKNTFAPLTCECRRTTHNLGAANLPALGVLRDWGFTPFIEQVQMLRRF